jgi:GWxTD domain-containing protein
MYRISFLLAMLFIFSIADADAQRRATTYESLLQRTDQPSSYIDQIVIPKSDTESMFAVFFRLDYDFLPFLRKRPDMTTPTPDAEYFSTLRMGVEVFEGPAPSSRRSSGAISVFRDSWQDTVWVDSFEATKSRFDYVEGFISTELDSGQYHYELQLARAQSVREQSSSRRTFRVSNPENTTEANFIILSQNRIDGDKLHATLMNYGNNVLYGQDYSLLIRIPEKEELQDKTLTLNLYMLGAGQDSEEGEIRHSIEITNDHTVHIKNPALSRVDNQVILTAEITDEGYKYAYVDIPNQDFENARFRLSLMAEGREKHIGERIINSQWLDMPVSLYNLDVAIGMLRFIVSDEELRRINSGSTAEKERKFREFWAQRDPTPDTEFNELMAEYYRRIDHAYKNFTSLQSPGYDTDQGKAYIVYGPPLNVERRLPTNAPTREIWQYPNRTLIFEATTGFGDFRLISES